MNSVRKYIHLLLAEKPRLLIAVCVTVLLIILVAGFWPFNFFPKNKVTWLQDRDGVRFYGQSMIISADSGQKQQSSPFYNKSISLELWLRPALETGNAPSILTLYDGKSPDLLAIKQWRSHLVSRSRVNNPAARKRGKAYQEIGFLNILPKGRDTFITITVGSEGTILYCNGQLIKTYPRHRLLPADPQGNVRLILGNSPSGESYWTGDMMGLAFFNRPLTPEEVFRHYQSWVGNDYFSIKRESGLISLYPFYERKGEMINNIANPDEMLIIPEIFKPLQREILSVPWREINWNWSFAQDVTINLLGFIPFGFFFVAFLLKFAGGKRLPAFMLTAILGIAISLLIEMSQAYLPTRDSSLVDVAMNSAGTILGVVLFSWLNGIPELEKA